MQNIALIFGAKSAEHEVSIVTGLQAFEWIDKSKYNPYLLYLDYQNQAFLCPSPKSRDYKNTIKKCLAENRKVQFIHGGIIINQGLFKKKILLDAVIMATHGGNGEDGKLQGLLDFYNIPYTGSGVLGSALGMDKILMKDIFLKHNLPLAKHLWFLDKDYQGNPGKIIDNLEKNLNYPLFVKPANGGSSVGVTRVVNQRELKEAIKTANLYDRRIIIEEEIKDAVDINCAVIGGYDLLVTPCEQPLKEKDFLTFEEKYLKGGKTKGMGGLARIIPAPIPDKIAKNIQEIAKTVFLILNCWGTVRIDFLYQKETKKYYVCEVNTIPGSLAFYLFQASDITPSQMLDRMIELALHRQKEQDLLSYSFKSKILDPDQK